MSDIESAHRSESVRSFALKVFPYVVPLRLRAGRDQRRTPLSALDVVSYGYDRHVLVFPNPNPVRLVLQLSIRRVCAGHARTGELHAAGMKDEPAPIDE